MPPWELLPVIRVTDLKVPLEYDSGLLKRIAAERLKCKAEDITEVRILKRAVDARKKNNIYFVFTLEVKCRNEEKIAKDGFTVVGDGISAPEVQIRKVKFKTRPVVTGFGPAGIFAALTLAKAGADPIVLERGDIVDKRLEKVNKYWKNGILDTESNVQFGEGGAGTFSDGKLTTGINDPAIRTVLNEFAENGAPPEILYLAKPHIGTDNLTAVVKNIRKKIVALGGEILFNARLCDLNIADGKISGCSYFKDGQTFFLQAENVILATGHSARDIFELLHQKNIPLSSKSFSVGMRIEHLQEEVNKSQYGKFRHHKALGAADYKYAVHLPGGRSVYTFCMCPGGSVVASASEKDAIVTNGMSSFSRSGANANSALLVGVGPADFNGSSPLAGVYFQRDIEQKAFFAAGKNCSAPVILAGDFLTHRNSTGFGKVKPTYQPSTSFVQPDTYLPDYICESLRQGLMILGGKAEFFRDMEAVLTGPETRSSSPVRINRDEKCVSTGVKGLFPCGEGAGYAGGIMSAAVDGIKCAESVIAQSSFID